MSMELDEVKLYLRIDNDEEDSLIISLQKTATELVEGVLRRKLAEFNPVPETIKQAILYVVATLYESRQIDKSYGLQINDLTNFIKRILFEYRDERF